jgi:4-hydroxybenzoate polyprenyltransferase
MAQKTKALLDLLRIHFFFVWPTLFSAGLFVGFFFNGGFSPLLILQAVLIGFLGFEAGLVLNDIVDADIDRKELAQDKGLTKYWRPFGQRPISGDLISRRQATVVFALLAASASAVIFTLPYPHSLYVFALLAVCYCLEVFYQIKKRNEKTPVAQIVGRVDFALFLVAGYLCVGNPDLNALLLFLFFYPLALAHLGVNDLVDVGNDRAKGMNTPTTLYGIKNTVYWVAAFSVAHVVLALLFLSRIWSLAAALGFSVALTLIVMGNMRILKGKTPQIALKALPMFHVAMLIYALTIIANYFLAAV